MYAIILTGGKQYKVEEGKTVKVEALNAEVGSKVVFDAVLLSNDGNIVVADDKLKAAVEAEVTFNGKGKKVVIFKYKSKKNERKRQGHRQPYTEIKVTKIKA